MEPRVDQQEKYIRARDNPFFDGMRRGEAAVLNKGRIFDFQEKLSGKNIFRSASDIGERGSRKINVDVSEDVDYSPTQSPSDIVLEPIGRSLSGRWSRTSSPLAVPQSNSEVDYDDDVNVSLTVSNPIASNENEECLTLTSLARPGIKRSYTVSKRGTNLSNVPLPPSAAQFYHGHSPHMEVVESCEGVYKLNMYLKAKRDCVSAGIPGRFLHAVIGPDVADVGSVASTIMYAFYLDETLKSNQFCTVPVINMKREDVDSRANLKWLFDSCHIDMSSLIFINEIDLYYYDLFGSLKLVLLNCDKLPSKQEALKEALVEIFHCRKSDTSYSRVDSVIVGQDASCCTVIAEKFALTSPEILAGQGFSRLLLAGILLDTENLSSTQCTSKDKYMATLLLNGAGRYGCNGLYQILSYRVHDVSNLRVGEILRKEFKKWTTLGKPESRDSRLPASNIGMSSIGVEVAQLLLHDSTSTQEIMHFQQYEKLCLLIVVSGYYDSQNNFKREILVSAESAEFMRNLLQYLNSYAAQLPLKVKRQPGLRGEMRVFEIDKVTSRRTIERLLEEYSVLSK
ncbi:protein prune-like protein [Abeliophyllum distichum]|uniref:Protein prune-like protein n=1 Tax=Abeliophyllum distichum TaxID=126358 RepID=A0ABD1PU39_9LAMI